jgi:hypothetical protein
LDNAEAILEDKNERTASLYLDGLLTPPNLITGNLLIPL